LLLYPDLLVIVASLGPLDQLKLVAPADLEPRRVRALGGKRHLVPLFELGGNCKAVPMKGGSGNLAFEMGVDGC
jgi:hypothetical protein